MIHGLPRLVDERVLRSERSFIEQPGEARPSYADKPPEKTLVRARAVPAPVAAPLPEPVAALPSGPMKRTHHSLEFKLMAIERVRRGETQHAVSRELGVHQAVIGAWCNGRGLRRHAREPEPIVKEKEREMPKKGQKIARPNDAKRKSVIAQVLAGKKTQTLIAKENRVPVGTVSSWMAQHRKENGQASPLRAKKASVPAKAPASNGSTEGGSALERLLERKLERKLEKYVDQFIEAKLGKMLEKKLGG